MQLTNRVVTKRIKPDASGYTVAAGTSDVNSDIVNTTGYEGVRFIAGFGAITSGAVTSLKVQEDTDAAMGGAQDIAGSGITIADTDDNKIAITDIYRPRSPYVRVAFDRGTQNAVIDFLIVELYGSRKLPVTQDTTVLSAELSASPAEGTA